MTADTLKKLGIAPNNESYVINVLRHVGVVSEEGNRTEVGQRAFSQSGDRFTSAFEPLVRSAYSELFDLHGDEAWNLGKQDLVAFFRTEDGSSDLVGTRQATTFTTLAALTGHGDIQEPRQPRSPRSTSARATTVPPKNGTTDAAGNLSGGAAAKEPLRESSAVALTVRVQVNLPAINDQEVYDKIFRSLRANLIDGPIS